MNTAAWVIIGALASELSLKEKIFGHWEFELENVVRKENSETKLQMACVEDILPTKQVNKRCVDLI